MAHSAPLPNIMEAVQGVHYPTDATSLLQQAEANGAAQTTLKLLSRLPEREYSNVSDVNHALGKIEDSLPSDQRFWASGVSQELEDEGQMHHYKGRIFDQNLE
jgi:hypothetical protein